MLSESETALESLRGELKSKDNIFRDVDGFLDKYFENRSWTAAVRNTIRDAKSADIVNELSANIFNTVHLDTLMDWLIDFRSLFFTTDPNIRFRCESITTPESRFSASIYLETEDDSTVAGSLRVYGEYHHGDALVTRGDDDYLPFAARALQVFKAQPTRHFLHAFILRGATLELWVFDRAGVYSSKLVDLAQNPQDVLCILAGYGMMNDEESGVNTFVKRLGPGSDSHVSFDEGIKLYLRPEMLAAPGHLVGLGTTCFAASQSTVSKPNSVVKFSWRADTTTAELKLLQLAHERKVWGIIQLLGHQDLVSISDLRQPLQFPRSLVNRKLSCVATSPLGRPIRKFASIRELLEVLGDLVKALRSLYLDGRMLHRDIAIKNLIINPQPSGSSSKGILIDFDMALDLDQGPPPRQIVGSDGFMAIGVLFGHAHSYRHDLESLFYVFLWLAIANDSGHDHAYEILERLPESRLQKWYSPVLNFPAVGQAVINDMKPEAFEGILGEFSDDFIPLKGLAKELHEMIFPVRDGAIFIGTDKGQEAAKRLYTGMEDAFKRSAMSFEE
ncbi:hypothetical protein HDV62DRAFT_379399 [Trichoderma sp. SZMC 28011]